RLQPARIWPRAASGRTRSQTILVIARIGVERIAPGTPQSQYQNARDRMTRTGLERYSITLNRHCEERSDEAIQGIGGQRRWPWIASLRSQCRRRKRGATPCTSQVGRSALAGVTLGGAKRAETGQPRARQCDPVT